MSISAERAFRASRDSDGSWSVIDCRTGLAVVVDGVPMVLLTEGTAIELAQVLNDLAPKGASLH
jgi:CO dehydrogenase/acetyl-CoA synthase alpha subunit